MRNAHDHQCIADVSLRHATHYTDDRGGSHRAEHRPGHIRIAISRSDVARHHRDCVVLKAHLGTYVDVSCVDIHCPHGGCIG